MRKKDFDKLLNNAKKHHNVTNGTIDEIVSFRKRIFNMLKIIYDGFLFSTIKNKALILIVLNDIILIEKIKGNYKEEIYEYREFINPRRVYTL